MKPNAPLSRLARLTQPGLLIGVIEESLQVICEVIAAVAGIATAAQFVRIQATGRCLTSS